MKKLLMLTSTLVVSSAFADSYNIYFPDTIAGNINSISGNIYIVNTDSRQVVGFDSSDYVATYSSASNSFASTDYVQVDGTSLRSGSNGRIFQDFSGSTLTIRENRVLQVRDKGVDGVANTGDDGDNRTYDRIVEIDVSSGEVTSTTLVASSLSDYQHAVDYGHTVVLEEKDASADTLSGMEIFTMTTYSSNETNSGTLTGDDAVVTDGNFSTNKITASDGSSLFRQESDGTVHIGENSIVLADELVSNSGYDQIYSSSGVLELGNTSSHRTVITGTLEIQDPTAPGHAATKRYADGIAALSNAIAIMPRAPEGKSMLTLGTGYLDGESALAIGVSSRPVDSDLTFNFATSYNKTVSTPAFAAGVGWEF